MNRFLAANILVFIVLVASCIWLIWAQLQIETVWKIGASLFAVIGCAYVEERYLSKIVNTLIGPRK